MDKKDYTFSNFDEEVSQIAGSPAIDEMIARKEGERLRVGQVDAITATVKGSFGAVAGAVLGFGAMLVTFAHRGYQVIHQQDSEKARRVLGTASGEEKEMLEEAAKVISKEEKMAGEMMRKPQTFLGAAAVTGAVVGIAMEYQRHKRKQGEIQNDLESLKAMKNSWKDTVSSPQTDHEGPSLGG